MPVGPFATFGACVAAQQRRGHSKVSAQRICGAIERDMKKFNATICKTDDERQWVYGWANIVMKVDGEVVTDHQDDQIEPAELEAASVDFMLESRESGVMHKGDAVADVIASFVTTPELVKSFFGLEPGTIPVGWLIGVHVRDAAIYKRVKSGELSMFSIEGSCERVPA